MNWLLILSSLLFFNTNAMASSKEANATIDYFDTRTYHPELTGLKDLTFEVRVGSLVKQLNEKLIFGELKDVHFKVYWLYPGKFDVEVIGLPNGFHEIKANLIAMVTTRLDYILPRQLGPNLRSYDLTQQVEADGAKTITAKDPTNVKDINEIILKFDKEGKLVSYTTKRPIGVETSILQMASKPWSNNKWVTDQAEVKTYVGLQSTSTINAISYKQYGNFGFPEKINVVTKQTLIQPASQKKDTYERELTDSMSFTNYKVNSGEALKKLK